MPLFQRLTPPAVCQLVNVAAISSPLATMQVRTRSHTPTPAMRGWLCRRVQQLWPPHYCPVRQVPLHLLDGICSVKAERSTACGRLNLLCSWSHTFGSVSSGRSDVCAGGELLDAQPSHGNPVGTWRSTDCVAPIAALERIKLYGGKGKSSAFG